MDVYLVMYTCLNASVKRAWTSIYGFYPIGRIFSYWCMTYSNTQKPSKSGLVYAVAIFKWGAFSTYPFLFTLYTQRLSFQNSDT